MPQYWLAGLVLVIGTNVISPDVLLESVPPKVSSPFMILGVWLLPSLADKRVNVSVARQNERCALTSGAG